MNRGSGNLARGSGLKTRSRREATPLEWREGLGACVHCGTTENVEGHHIIPRQTLRFLGLPLWDVRNRLTLCRLRHERHTTQVEPLTAEDVPAIAYAYADELSLGWYLAKHYRPAAELAA